MTMIKVKAAAGAMKCCDLSVCLCSLGGRCVPLAPHHLRSPTMVAALQAMLYDLPVPALSPAPLCSPCNDCNNTTTTTMQ